MFENLTEHPRLLANGNDFNKIRELIKTNENYYTWWEITKEAADKTVATETLKEFNPRAIKKNVMLLSFVYQITQDNIYAKSATEHLLAACIGGECKFTDWNENAFIDTGELTSGIAYGYDWIYDYLTVEQRKIIKDTIVKWALYPAMGTYKWYFDNGERPPHTTKDFARNGWVCCEHNWNFVCNGGIAIGALSIADEEPMIAKYCLNSAIKSMHIALDAFTKEGAWGEGPTYWGLSMDYFLEFLSCAKTSIGETFDLEKSPGISQTWTFPFYITGTNGLTFNFCDGGPIYRSRCEQLYLARLCNNSRIAQYRYDELKRNGGENITPFDFVWFYDKKMDSYEEEWTLDKYYPNCELVTMRSSWNDENALFFGIKAGDNKVNHADLDAGSFVLDALGVRWFYDLGSDEYSLPNFWLDDPTGCIRWKYYRKSAQGHNTLVINPKIYPDQDPGSHTKFTYVYINNVEPIVTCDLALAYAEQGVTKFNRTAKLLNNRTAVLLEDELETNEYSQIWWSAHTTSQIHLDNDNKRAVLENNGKKLVVDILSGCGDLKFDVMEAVSLPNSCNISHPIERDRSMFKKLSIKVENAKNVKISVRMTPIS